MEVTSIKTKEFLLPFHFKSCFEKSSLSLLGTLHLEQGGVHWLRGPINR
jgi:hypothetical protein